MSSYGRAASIVGQKNFSSTNSGRVHGIKGCGQFHPLAVGTAEEYFLSRIVLDRGLGEPQDNTGRFGEERKALPLPGIEPPVLGLPISVAVD